MSPVFEILARTRDRKDTSVISEPLNPEDAPVSSDIDPCADPSAIARTQIRYAAKPAWNPDSFAEQQIRSLIQAVFYPGWPRPSRQVVFSSIDQFVSAGSACARIAVTMAKYLPGTVCAVEADCDDPTLE